MLCSESVLTLFDLTLIENSVKWIIFRIQVELNWGVGNYGWHHQIISQLVDSSQRNVIVIWCFQSASIIEDKSNLNFLSIVDIFGWIVAHLYKSNLFIIIVFDLGCVYLSLIAGICIIWLKMPLWRQCHNTSKYWDTETEARRKKMV